MKKILGISLVAVFAVAPLMARAETGLASEPTHAATASSGNTTTAAPQYEVASADSATDGNLATAGYVKGAYNAAIRGINKVAADAVQTANLADKSLAIDAASVKINGADALTSAALDGYATEAYAKNGANLTAGTVAKTALAEGVQSSLGKADTALQSDSALNGANLTAGTVAATSLSEAVQSSLAKADSALQSTSDLNGAKLQSGTVAKTALAEGVQSSLGKADTALQSGADLGAASVAETALATDVQTALASARTALQSTDIADKADKATTLAGYGIGDAYTKTQVDSAISSSASTTLQSAQDYAKNGANLTAGTVAKTALATDVQTSLGKADSALQSADIANMATQNGVLATINSATVPVMTTWGSTAVDTTSLKVKAPAAYVPGAGE